MKRKWIIVAATLIAGAIAYALTMNQPPLFRSTAQVATGYTTTDPIKMTNENTDYFGQETKFNNAIVTFTSPAVIHLLSYNLILHDLQETPFKVLKPEERQMAFKGISKEKAIALFQTKLDSMQMLSSSSTEDKQLLNILSVYGYDFGSITSKLSVSRFQRSDFLNISYVSEHPALSAYAVNRSYDEYTRYYGNNRGQKVSESLDTLKAIMDRKKQILDEKNNILQQAGITLGDDNSNNISELSIIANLEGELSTQRSQLNRQQAELRKVNQKLASLGSTPETPRSNNDEILQLKALRDEAYRTYLRTSDPADKKKYDDLVERYQQLVTAQRATTPMGTDPITSRVELQSQKTDLEIDIQSISSYIGTLTGRINALKGAVTSGSSSNTGAAESLKRDRELANQEYLDAKQRYNAASDLGGSNLSNFRMIVPGQPALAPEPSKRPLIIALAAFAALFTTIAIIIFLTFLDSSVRTPLIFQKNVNLKLISLVNFMNLKNKNIKDIIANTYVSTDSEEAKRNNTFRESLRKLRYEIETSGKKVLLFTSTKKGQGKTTLIQALAYSMSLSKKRVLIIDTNFCNNDLTVQLDAEPILEKIVPRNFDDTTLVAEIKKYSKDLGAGSIYAIGSAGGDYTPSEILPREHLLHHLKSLTSFFDYIFLEGPPLNDFSDSKELAQYVEGVIAVFSAQGTIKQIDRQSIAFFKDDLNGKFTGSILNMVDLKNVNVV